MKKILCICGLCGFLLMTGCGQKQNAASAVREVFVEEAEVSFVLNDLWTEHDAKEPAEIKEGQKLVFSASKTETGAAIDILWEDLNKTHGGTLVRMEDYVSGILEQLKQAGETGDYEYTCSETQTEEVYGKEYISFQVQIAEMDATQKFLIRRHEDTMTIMIISVFGGEKIEDILALGKEM